MTPEPARTLPSLFDAMGPLTPERARRVVVLLGLTRPRQMPAEVPQPQAAERAA